MSIPTLLDPLGKLGQHITVDLKQFRCPGLPEGYKLCSYVQPTARTCFIDTGIPSTDKVGFQITYQWDGTNPESAQGEVIIGAGDAELNTRQWINNTSTGYLHIGWGTDRHHTTTSPSQSDIPTDKSIIWGQVNFMLSNTASCSIPTSDEIQLGYDSNFSGETLYLFANHGATANNNHTLARLYRCRISDGRRIKRDFIPIRRESDGKYGLFETVEKKVYFPEQGSLTGSELSSLWDYSHFNGSEGAYIDDYPTPNSPNFVKTSGIEAGMAQIREALMVGPMLSDTLGYSNNLQNSLSTFIKNAALPNSVFYNLINSYTPNIEGLGNFNRPWVDNVKRGGLTFGYGDLFLGYNNSKFKSFYFVYGRLITTIGSWTNGQVVGIQNNCDYLIRIHGNQVTRYFYYNDAWQPSYAPINTTARLVAPLGYYNYSSWFARYSGCPVFAYLPLGCRDRINITYYKPHKYTKLSCYIPSTCAAPQSGYHINNNPILCSNSPLDSISIVNVIKYIGKLTNNVINSTITIGINSQYFDTPVVTTEEVAETESTSDTYSKLTASTTKNEVIVTRTQVTAASETTTGKLKTTTVWTLLPNTHEKFGKECRQLREALWNTNGVNGTSTGLLDGVMQVGKNTGVPYSNNWSLELHPIVHTWAD